MRDRRAPRAARCGRPSRAPRARPGWRGRPPSPCRSGRRSSRATWSARANRTRPRGPPRAAGAPRPARTRPTATCRDCVTRSGSRPQCSQANVVRCARGRSAPRRRRTACRTDGRGAAPREVARLGQTPHALPLDRLCQKEGDVFAAQLVLEGREVVEGHERDARQQGLEPGPLRRAPFTDIAPSVRPWKPFSTATTRGRRTAARASLRAASTASVPLLTNSTRSSEGGATRTSASASSPGRSDSPSWAGWACVAPAARRGRGRRRRRCAPGCNAEAAEPIQATSSPRRRTGRRPRRAPSGGEAEDAQDLHEARARVARVELGGSAAGARLEQVLQAELVHLTPPLSPSPSHRGRRLGGGYPGDRRRYGVSGLRRGRAAGRRRAAADEPLHPADGAQATRTARRPPAPGRLGAHGPRRRTARTAPRSDRAGDRARARRARGPGVRATGLEAAPLRGLADLCASPVLAAISPSRPSSSALSSGPVRSNLLVNAAASDDTRRSRTCDPALSPSCWP